MKLKLYLAGPMTGLPGLNFPAFHRAAEKLRQAGHEVINPAELNPDQSIPWEHAMRKDIAALVTCDSIALLPGWGKSRGATLEHHIAERLGMKVFLLLPESDRAVAVPEHVTDWSAA